MGLSNKTKQYSVVAIILLVLIALRLFLGRSIRKDTETANSPRATQKLVVQEQGNPNWEVLDDFRILGRNDSIGNKRDFLSARLKKKVFGSELLNNQQVYVSLTTIHNRVYGISDTIKSIIEGSVLPDHIYLFVSRDAYLLDEGITESFLSSKLEALKVMMVEYPFISVVFTENIGPHRKLLPLLSKKWNEDCVLITVDDHEIYPVSSLASLLYGYINSNQESVVALRSRRMGVCNRAPPFVLAPYTNAHSHGLWPESPPGVHEMLTLPTGMGGILYRPRFFHPVIFNRKLLNLTATGDDLMFRLATMANGVSVVTACSPDAENANHPCTLVPAILANFIAAAKVKSERKASQAPQYSAELNNFQKQQSMSSDPNTSAANLKSKDNRSDNYIPDLQSSNSVGFDSAGSKSIPHIEKPTMNAQDSVTMTAVSEFADTLKLQQDQQQENRNHQQPQPQHVQREHKSTTAAATTTTTIPDGYATIYSGIRHRERRRERRVLRTGEDRKSDPRKISSLASLFNNIGGNTVMWDSAVEYLREKKIFDFSELLQREFLKERRFCLLSEDVFQPHSSPEESSNILWSAWRNAENGMRVYMQNIYSKDCGVQTCDWK